MFHVEQFEGWIEVLREGVRQFGLSLHDYTLTQFAVYLKELGAWNEKTNLTGSHDEREVVIKHFVDSMAACRVLTPVQGYKLIDIGSGAGFPGLVLKLAIPDLEVTLLEPSQKRVAFLRHLIGRLHLKEIDVVDQRIQEYAGMQSYPGMYDWITVRALSISSLLGPARSLLSENGKLLLFRSRGLERKFSRDIESNKYSIFQQFNYSLIYDSGERVLTILKKNNDEMSQQERG
jgi:16S rRNA (guanine527-N7)-methyltransferase